MVDKIASEVARLKAWDFLVINSCKLLLKRTDILSRDHGVVIVARLALLNTRLELLLPVAKLSC